MTDAVTVLLLRSPQDPPDPYEQALEAAGFSPRCEPVLRFVFVNDEALANRLTEPDRYSGLVLTSPRAVEALRRVWSTVPAEAWAARRTYVVGPRTGEAARRLGLTPEGEEAGTGAELAEIIATRPAELPLLFLCGNLRRDTVPDALGEAGVAYEELCVYETHLCDDLRADDLVADVLVVFSPSGVEVVQRVTGSSGPSAALVAIGPTTAAEVRALGWAVAAVALSPTPEGVVEALEGLR